MFGDLLLSIVRSIYPNFPNSVRMNAAIFLFGIWIGGASALLVGVLPYFTSPEPDISDRGREAAVVISALPKTVSVPYAVTGFPDASLLPSGGVVVNTEDRSWLVNDNFQARLAFGFCNLPPAQPPQGTPIPCTVKIAAISGQRNIHWDFIILLFTAEVFLTLVAKYGGLTGVLYSSGSAPNTLSSERGAADIRSNAANLKLPAYGDMQRDVQLAIRRADALFARSNLMLLSGIIVAFLGVGLFSVLTGLVGAHGASTSSVTVAAGNSPPSTVSFQSGANVARSQSVSTAAESRDTTGKADVNYFWNTATMAVIQNFRPTTIFIFLETISWYLLRQYRALVEDYKAFYRIYLRRENLLVAYVISNNHTHDKAAALLVVGSMLHEDFSGRLKQNERLDSEAQLAYAGQPQFSSVIALIKEFGNAVGQVTGPNGKGKPDGKGKRTSSKIATSNGENSE
jgi:hypothetical protein